MRTLTAIAVAIGVLTTSLAYGATTSTQFHLDRDARIVDLGLAPQSEVRQITLSLAVKNAAAMDAHNSFDAPNVVKPAPFAGASISDGTLTVALPAKSIVMLDLH